MAKEDPKMEYFDGITAGLICCNPGFGNVKMCCGTPASLLVYCVFWCFWSRYWERRLGFWSLLRRTFPPWAS